MLSSISITTFRINCFEVSKPISSIIHSVISLFLLNIKQRLFSKFNFLYLSHLSKKGGLRLLRLGFEKYFYGINSM
jgi:hypothetical protein